MRLGLACLAIILTSAMSFAAAPLDISDMESLVGGCSDHTAVCEDWWCPNGVNEPIPCDGAIPILDCGCYTMQQSVKRVKSPTGGNAYAIPNQDCASKWDCDWDILKFACQPTSTRCGDAWGGTYTRCVEP